MPFSNKGEKCVKMMPKWVQNPSKIHPKTVSKTRAKKVCKNDAKKVEHGSPKGAKNDPKIAKMSKKWTSKDASKKS